jgi:hypothetical protein
MLVRKLGVRDEGDEGDVVLAFHRVKNKVIKISSSSPLTPNPPNLENYVNFRRFHGNYELL